MTKPYRFMLQIYVCVETPRNVPPTAYQILEIFDELDPTDLSYTSFQLLNNEHPSHFGDNIPVVVMHESKLR